MAVHVFMKLVSMFLARRVAWKGGSVAPSPRCLWPVSLQERGLHAGLHFGFRPMWSSQASQRDKIPLIPRTVFRRVG